MKYSLAFLSLLSLAVALPAERLHKRQYTNMTVENQLLDGTPCRAVTVIFARGTTEQSNVGSLVGPPFFQALANEIGASNLAVQGVDYAADIPGFLAGGDVNGSATLASLAVRAEKQCPDTAVVLSGYSQGGQLVHNAAGNLTLAQSALINSGML